MSRHLLYLLPWFLGALATLVPSLSSAQQWSEFAYISGTMGVQDGHLCLGEASRGEIGCPTYAPSVSPDGVVGIGQPPQTSVTLSVSGSGLFSKRLDIGDPTATNNGYITLIAGNAVSGTFRFINDAAANYIQSGMDTMPMSAKDLRFGPYRANIPWMTIRATGNVGISTTSPQTMLDVRGSLRLAYETSTTLQTCDADRTGAIKYQSGDFFYCRNGTAWESLTSLTGGGGSAGDRIVSGTTGVYAKQNTSLSLVTAGTERMVIGTNGEIGIGQQPAANTALSVSGTGIQITNLVTDPSKTTFLSITASGNSSLGLSAFGSNYDAPWADASTVELAAYSSTKALQFRTSRTGYTAPFIFKMGSSGGTPAIEVARITSTGLALGVITPTVRLEVAGTASVTVVKLANNPPTPCDGAAIGTIKTISGKIYVCRQ